MTARLETVRIFVVVLSVLYALAFGVPTVLALNGYYGTVGLVRAGAIATLAPNVDVNTISSVAPGSPAARSGIVPGDVAVPLAAEHALVVQQLFSRVAAGRPIPYVVLHNEQRRVVMLTPTLETTKRAHRLRTPDSCMDTSSI
jgi:S1-C subfamily serine protease